MSPAKKEYIIVSVVCNEYKISVDDLTKPNPYPGKPNPHLEAKMVAMYLVRKNTFFGMTRIGPTFGYSGTVTMGHVENYVDAKAYNDKDFRKRMDKLRAILPQIFNIHK
jgi:chromosomal replication initiation ATPase DnaA